MARAKIASPPQVGESAPDFTLPGAVGGQLRLSIRAARGPVIVVFYRGVWSEECVEYFGALAEREREINVAGATLVGIGAVEPEEAREFSQNSGFNSYVLYDYIREATRAYSLLQKDAEHGDAARPAAFFVDAERVVRHAWLDERPAPDELLARTSEITGLPREPDEEEEAEEKPRKRPRRASKTDDGEAEEPVESEPAKSETSEKPATSKQGSAEEAKAEPEETSETSESGGEASDDGAGGGEASRKEES